MPSFQYKALRADGGMAEGHLEAAGRQEAFSQMAGLGLRPVSLSEKAGGTGGTGFALPAALASFSMRRHSARVSGRELENFTRLLSSLLAAGVPLSRALVILHKEASSPAAGAKWKEIHDLVVDGMSLADAMGKSPETFPRVYTATVQWHSRHALSVRAARTGPGGPRLSVDLLHPQVPGDLQGTRRRAAIADP